MTSQETWESSMRGCFAAIAVCLVLTGLWAGGASAEMPGRMSQMDDGIPMPVMRCGMMDDEHPLWRHLMKLGLDEKQLVTAREVRSSVMKDTIRKKADEQAAGIDLKDLLDRDPVDIKAVEAKLRQIESLRTEMRLSLIRAMEEIKLKLTPQQRKRLKEMPAMEPLAGRGVMGEMRHGPGGMPQVCDKQE